MPYITRESAKRLANLNMEMFKDMKTGELNYVITRLLVHYIQAKGVNYSNISSAIAAANDAAAECRRRLMDPYEDQKIYDINVNCDPYTVLVQTVKRKT